MSNLVPIHKSLESSLVDVPLLSKEVDESDDLVVYEESVTSFKPIILLVVCFVLATWLYVNFAFTKSES
ncbi:hypothetical protein L5515_011088 [Caenorhabditis briggsae]|nr:hypothetical protein L3Y34_003965 [Caenorhabditis briggsae]UMM28101.1 hypothetical protein L5515_011088 [Caenorhabditis briggsae]